MPSAKFSEIYRTQIADQDVHLDPVYSAAFQSDSLLVATKAQSLLAYQQYLAAARAAKAQSQGVSPAFERNVQANARQALDDMQALSAAALRVIRQVNNTGFWSQMLDNSSTLLKAGGTATVQQLWDEVQQALQDPQNVAAFANAGLTNDLAGEIGRA